MQQGWHHEEDESRKSGVDSQARAQHNGDGTLVAQTVGGTTTRYVQDLAAPLSQVLSSGGANYVYGNERLYASASGTKTWFGGDALGSVRETLNDAGAVQSTINYDPWGQVQSGAVRTFGFTGEQQDGSLVNLRARWYNVSGTFTSRDTFAGDVEQPYSLNPYQYGYANPVLNADPSGQVVQSERGGTTSNWAQFFSAYGSRFRLRNDIDTAKLPTFLASVGITPQTAARDAVAYEEFVRHPDAYPFGTGTYGGAQRFYEYLLGMFGFPPPAITEGQVQRLLERQDQGEQLSPAELGCLGGGLFALGFNDPIVHHSPDTGGGGGGAGQRLPNRGPGKVTRNALQDAEYAQAQEFASYRGGHFEGAPKDSFPGIDGWIDGQPVSLKGYTGTSPSAILRKASQAEGEARNAGYSNVELFISAKNVSKSRLLDFATQPSGKLRLIPTQGTISSISIQTSEGWVVIRGGP